MNVADGTILVSKDVTSQISLSVILTAVKSKMAVVFATIFIEKVQSKILIQSALTPLVCKRAVDNIFPFDFETQSKGNTTVNRASQ